MSFPRTVQVQIAFDNGPIEVSPTWTTLTGVREVRITRGRQGSTLQQAEAGRCTIILENSTRKYDPFNTSSSEYGNSFRLSPAKRVRVRYEIGPPNVAGTFYDQFTGVVMGYFPESPETPGAGLRIECLDAFGFLNTVKLNAAFIQQTTGNRINAILDSIAYPSGAAWRNIYTAGLNMQATTYANTTVLAALQEAADVQRGMLDVDASGVLVFRSQTYREWETLRPRLTFGTNQALGHVPYKKLNLRFDLRDVRNDVSVTRIGSTPETAFDASSISNYFRHTYSLTANFSNDLDANRRADKIVARYAAPYRSIDWIELSASLVTSSAPNLITYRATDDSTAAGLFPAQPITVIGTAPSGSAFSWGGFIEGYEHTIDARSQTWKSKIYCSPREFYSVWILGQSELSINTILDD